MKPPDAPPHVIAYRLRAGKIARRFLYGREIKGVPRDAEVRWGRLIGFFAKTGKLYYREMLGKAEQMGKSWADQMDPPEQFDHELDWGLWRIYREALYKLADEVLVTDPDRLERFNEAVPMGQRKMWAREALLNGICPICGEDVGEGDNCGHGYGRPEKHQGGWLVDG